MVLNNSSSNFKQNTHIIISSAVLNTELTSANTTMYGGNVYHLRVAGSGLRSVASGFQSIKSGDSKIIIAGGQESMSLSPHAIHLRDGKKLGNVEFTDTMIKDGLWDAFHGYHMGVTAENVATKFQVTRDQQDEFALRSQKKALEAQKQN